MTTTRSYQLTTAKLTTSRLRGKARTVGSAIRSFKAVVPVSVKARARYLLSPSSDDQFSRYEGKKKVIVALAADYGNMGDVAITYAQEKFLGSCLPEHEIVDFPISQTFTHLKALKRIVAPDDIVTIAGGGNMGDVHHTIEDCRRFVINTFPKNRIVSFPQTIDFSSSAFGKRELQKTIKTYQKHSNLLLFARESVSYDVMRKVFPEKSVCLAPDMVFFLDEFSPISDRRGIMICIRKDCESAMSNEERTAFLRNITSALTPSFEMDTHIGQGQLTVSQRSEKLSNILDSFGRAELVITDRLHGMIFSAITRTPCVVLKNTNHKIKATYETWLRPLEHIRLVENANASETLRAVEELSRSDKTRNALPTFERAFEELKWAVKGQ